MWSMLYSKLQRQQKLQKIEYIENNVIEFETSSRKFYLEKLEIVSTL